MQAALLYYPPKVSITLASYRESPDSGVCIKTEIRNTKSDYEIDLHCLIDRVVAGNTFLADLTESQIILVAELCTRRPLP